MLDICTAQLRLIETTDLHMQLTGYDYVLDNHEALGGLERLSGKIAALRSDGIETILCDNGDFLEGSPLADLAIELDCMQKHPMVCAMNHLKYDAIALGNHEFDYGSAKLQSVMDALDAPVVCSNVRVSLSDHFAAPWTIIDRELLCSDGQTRKIRVGVIGFVTPLQVNWGTRRLNEPLITDDIFAAAMTHLPALRRAGADIAVGLAHTGIGHEKHKYGMENAAQPLSSLRGIDVLMLGHTHDHFPSDTFKGMPHIDCEAGTIHGTPVVMAGHLGDTLGLIDLNLSYVDGDWEIMGHKAELIAASDEDAADAEFSARLTQVLAPIHTKTLSGLAAPVGQTPDDINTFFSGVGFDPALRLVSFAQKTAVQNGIVGSALAEIPVLGASASFRAGGRLGPNNFLQLPTGPLTTKHVAAMIPFNNPTCGVLRRGWQIRQWLVEMSRRFNTVTKGGSDQSLLNPHFPSYNFDCLLGLDYTFDLTAELPEAGSAEDCGRLPSIQFNGIDVLDDDLFIVAISRYRVMGGGFMGNVPPGDIVFETSTGIRSQFTPALLEQFDWPKSANWHFTPQDGTPVIFETSPLADVGDIDIRAESLGLTPKGFQKIRLWL